ncbi:uncharacterized protein Pbp95 [Prorops nasuta]|uniref:uncharacterized protein Pbp95 n=1 Tax=Prorops nasuta TaxID=863751 RepID=UPI0034CE17C5
MATLSTDNINHQLDLSKSGCDKEGINEQAYATYNLNKDLINILSEYKEKIKIILEECNTSLELIESELQEKNRKCLATKAPVAGMPYFKDKYCFKAPHNDDVKLKAARGELQIFNIRKLYRWTNNDRNILQKAICEESISKLLQAEDKDERNDKLITARMKTVTSSSILPTNFKEMIGPLGSKEFDWLKISITDFSGKHSPEECRVLWNIYLHPDINKSKWSDGEDNKLNKIAKKHNFQDWDKIAKQLNTNRSGYQCFVRYNTNRNVLNETSGTWTMEEDEKLLSLIDQLRIGDFIPWGEVASYMPCRTKHQVYFRWMYSIAPHLKKGRFTKEEDEILLNAVAKYGTNFAEISVSLMPNRSTVQLSDHYQNLNAKKTGCNNIWTKNEDKDLFKLRKELGRNWTTIAKHFASKTRTQVRHRYSALLKMFENRSFYLKFMNEMDTEDTTDNIKTHDSVDAEMEAINQSLIEHFKLMSTVNKSGRRKEKYNSLELQNYTQELYNILTSLEASLKIPKNLNDIPYLTEKDKQLLKSISEYASKYSKRTTNQELVEEVRIKMFGNSFNKNKENHYIPPPPFETRIIKNNGAVSNVIDYMRVNEETLLVKLEMRFNTPEDIISVIGIDTNSELDKLFILSQTKTSLQSEQHLQNINTIDARATYNHHNIHIRMDKLQSQFLPLSSVSSCMENKDNNDQQYVEVILKSIEQTTALKANYSTLLGLSHLKSWMDLQSLDNLINAQENIANNVREKGAVCNLLKNRLLQLLKYPIGMHQISLLEIHGEDEIFDNPSPKNSNEEKNNKRKKCEMKQLPNKKVKSIKTKR